MKVFMYDNVPNFGDVLNEYLWPKYFGEFINRKDNILMMGIGTVLGSNAKHEGQVIVCGSGAGYAKLEASESPDWKIFFVRGPQTAKALNLSQDMFITDPAILTPDVFPQAAKHGSVVFVPHWETSKNPLWKTLCEKADILYVDPLDDIKKVIAQISGAKLVIAEAMHAAIIADAYRVPWVPVSSSKRINEYKWNDWASSLGQSVQFTYLPSLGFTGRLFNITEKKGLQAQNAVANRVSAKAQLKKIYKKIFPDKWTREKHFNLLWKIAQKLDDLQNLLIKSGLLPASGGVVNQFKKLATFPGSLSSADISADKKDRMLKKFDEISDYLRNYRG